MKKITHSYIVVLIILFGCSRQNDFQNFTYPEGKHKALILSYDDGTVDDIGLARLFDDAGLVGTFNLNSGYLGTVQAWPEENDTVYQEYLSVDTLLSVFKNHEIAAHGVYHKDFFQISDNEIVDEVNSDISKLIKLTGRKIKSLAYPFGNSNKHISTLVQETGLNNARTVDDTYNFDLPTNYLLWNPTCHDSQVLSLVDDYTSLKSDELSLFYVWGHSWEFKDVRRWNNMKSFCEKISGKKDIWYVGSGAYIEYLEAIKKVQITRDKLINPKGNMRVWVEQLDELRILEPGDSLNIVSGK